MIFKIARNPYLILFLIVLVGFIVRLYKIDNPVADWHSWRQADTASVTRIYVQQGIDLLRPKYYDISFLQSGKFNPQGWRFVEFPVYNAVHAILFQNIEVFSLEKWGRLLSVFSSLVSLIFVYFLGRRFLGQAGGLVSALLFGVMPFNIYFSRVILPEPMAVTFSLGALLFFVLWFDKNKNWQLIVSGLMFALALLVKPYTIFYGVPMLWLAGLKFKWNTRQLMKSKQIWLFLIITFVPLLAWRAWILQHPEGIPFYKWVFNSDNIRFRPAFWKWIFGERLGNLMLGGWGIFAFVAGVLGKLKKDDLKFPLMFVLGSFLYVSTIATANVRHDYYQTLVVPAIAIVLARGILYLWETKEFAQPYARIISAATVIFGMGLSWYSIKEFYKINHPEIIRAGEVLDKIAPKDALVVAPYNGDTAFLYQTKRQGWPYQTNSVEELISFGADYYISVNLGDPQTQDAARKFEVPFQNDEFIIIDLNRKRMPKN